MPSSEKKPRKLSKQQEIIHAFLKDPSSCYWAKETRFANILIKRYSFEWLISLKNRTRVISLIWFLGENGKKFLEDIKRYQSLEFKKEKYELQNDPVAPPQVIDKKPETVKDFLNLFN